MPKVKSIEDMTVPELDTEIERISNEVARVRATLRQAVNIREIKIAQLEATNKVAAMNETERAALVQALALQGIESAEAFGKM